MKLEKIGFYTLEDKRAETSCLNSPLWRNELIITSRCNFKCPYCRGTDINGLQGDMPLLDIKRVIDFWASENVQNVRFSGGEPSIHKDIEEIIRYTKNTCKGIKHIAISTNGYSDIKLYKKLVLLGVNDYSISLDACCSSIGDMMAGGIKGSWEKVIANIRELSKLTYVTVGVVFDKQNSKDMYNTIMFAHDLGVADIRIISAAQWNNFEIFQNLNLPQHVLDAHPILKYRVNNFTNGRNVRGIEATDSHRCGLIVDDSIIKGDYHYPCVIKMREGCTPIGKITDSTVRQDRYNYYLYHDCYKDEVCRKNCLDVCVDYNNKFERFKILNQDKVPRVDYSLCTWDKWCAGSVHNLGIKHFRYDNAQRYKDIILKDLFGYCFADNILCRPKSNHVALIYEDKWFHIRNNEFVQLIS